MNELIIIEFNSKTYRSKKSFINASHEYKSIEGGNRNEIYDMTYDNIIDLMIKGQKLRFQYPKNDLCCRIESCALVDKPEITRILANIFDHVIITHMGDKNVIDQIKKTKHYNIVKNIDASYVGLDDSIFDTNYEYYQLKTIIGPTICKHFMFKERDIEIYQRGGVNFNEKKIRYQKKHSDPKLDIICDLYKTKHRFIKHDHLKYYHTNTNTQYRPFNVNPMFDRIKKYDYITPLQNLCEYHSAGSYYSQLYERTKDVLLNTIDTKTRLNLIDKISTSDRDSIIFEYLKCRPKTVVITLWKPAIIALDKFVELLEKNGEVYYIKPVTLSKQGLYNLLFWYYDDFTYTERLNFIDKKMKYMDVTEENNPICYILFDNINNTHLSGNNSQFKNELRNEIIKCSGLSEDKCCDNDLFNINDYFYQTIEYSQLLLNKNSINVLNNQNCRVYATNKFAMANLKMQTLRNIVYSNMSLLETNRMMIIGDSVLYSHGMIAFNDIDVILIDINPCSSIEMINTIKKLFSNKNSKIFFLDAKIQGGTKWNKLWTKDLVLDPEYYFYHQGLKMMINDYEIK